MTVKISQKNRCSPKLTQVSHSKPLQFMANFVLDQIYSEINVIATLFAAYKL